MTNYKEAIFKTTSNQFKKFKSAATNMNATILK